jgi:hypothetical protein
VPKRQWQKSSPQTTVGPWAAGPCLPNLAVTLPESSADSFHEWLEDFVIEGNSGPGCGKDGTLEYLSPDLREVHFKLSLCKLGIFKLMHLPSGHGNMRSMRAEMYCEQVSLEAGATTK